MDEGGLLEEIQVLESIYIEELDVKRNDMDEVTQIILQLHPSTGEDLNQRYVCMTLILDLSSHYPDVPPDFTIRNPRGISEEEVLSLREDMHKLCEERKGGPVLFELIELAKDSLTAGNIPHCLCMICLEHFSEGEKFTKTECYHYFHEGCLSRYVHHILTQTPEVVPAHAMPDPEKNKLVCPVCREEIKYELDDFEIVSAEDNFEYTPTSEMRDLQNKMAEILERQKAIGGIIDVEAEKNKYLVKHDDVVLLSLPKPKENKDPKRKSSGRRYEKVELDLTKDNFDDGKPGNDKANKNTEKRPYGKVKGRGFRFNENPPRQSNRGEKEKGGRKEKEDFRDNLSNGYYSDDYDEIELNKGAKNNSKGDGRTFNNDRQSYHRERDKDTYKDRRNMNVKHKETDRNSSVRNRDDEREHKVKQIESTDNKVSIEDEIESNDNNKKSENNSQSNESEQKIVQQEPNTNCEIEDNLKSVDAVEQKKDESTSVTKEKENIRKEINKTENDEKSKFEFKDYKRGGFSRPHSGNKDRRTENKNDMDVRKNNIAGFGKPPSQKNDKDNRNEMKDGTYNRKGGFGKPNGSKVNSNERIGEKVSANKSEVFNRKTDERYDKTNNQASEKSNENRQNQGGRSFNPSSKNYDRQSSGESRVSDQSKPYEKRGGFGNPGRRNYSRQSSEKKDKDDVHETDQNKRVHSGGFGKPPAKNKPEDWESEISDDSPRSKDILEESVTAQADDPKRTIDTEKQDCKTDEVNEIKQGQNQLKTERRDNREYPDRRNRYEKCYGDSDSHNRAGGNRNYRNKHQKSWRAHEDNETDSNLNRRDSGKYERNEKDLNINISNFDKSDLNKNNNARTDYNSHKSEDTDRKHEKDGESDHAALVTISESAHSSWKKDGRKEVGRQEKESKHTDMESGKIHENNHEKRRQHNSKWGDEKHFDRHQKDRRYNHDGRKEVYHKGNVVNKFDERTSSAGNSRAKSEKKYSDSEWQERDREYHHGNKVHHKVSDGKYNEPRQGNQQERDREYHHGNKVHHKVSDGKYNEPRQGNQQERDREYHHGNKVHHTVSDGKYNEPRQGNQQERDREYHHGNKVHHKVSDGKYNEPRQGNQQERDREYHHGNKVHHKVSDGKYNEPRQGNQQERDREYHHGNKVHHKVSDGKYNEPRQGNQQERDREYHHGNKVHHKVSDGKYNEPRQGNQQERDREYHHGNKVHHKVSDGKYNEPRQGNQQERDREYHHGNKVHHKVSDGKYNEPRQGNQQERDREYHHGNKVHHKVSDGKYNEPRQGNQQERDREYHHGNKVHHKVSDGKYNEPRQGNQQERDREYHHGNKVHHKVSDGKYSEPRQGNQRPNRRLNDSHHNHEHDGHDSWREERDNKHHKEGPNLSKKQYNKTITSSHSFKDSPKGSGEVVEDIDNVERKFSELDMTESQSQKGQVDKDDRRNLDDKDVKRENDKAIQSGSKSKQFEETRNIDVSRTNKEDSHKSGGPPGFALSPPPGFQSTEVIEGEGKPCVQPPPGF